MTDMTTISSQDASTRDSHNSPERIRVRAQAAYDRISSALSSLIDQGKPTPIQAHDTLRDLASIMAGLDQLSTQVQPQPAAALAVVISPLDRDAPAGKRADAELHFLTGPLTGSRLIGFGIWTRRTSNGHNVTFPARTYRVNGDSRSFALLRPAAIGGDTHQGITDMILRAFEEWQERGQTRIDFTSERQIMSVAGTKLEAPPLPAADRQVCLNPSLADLERADHMAGKHDAQARQLCPVCRLDREGPAEPDEDARARNTMPGPLAQAAEIIRTNDRIDPGILIAAGLAQAAQDARQQQQPQAPKAPRARRF